MEDCLFFDYMYGKHNPTEETNKLVAAKLTELEKEINQLPGNLNEAYFVALGQEIKQQITYVRSKKFLLAFLRAEDFDTPKAATRLCKFLGYKLDLFGAERLSRQIYKDDLNDDDLKIVDSGFIDNCGLDCGGRSVYIFLRERLNTFGLLNDNYTKNISRAAFYQLMSSIEGNEVCQKNGFVGIRWDCNCTHSLKDYRILALSIGKMVMEAFPVKFVALHFCSDNKVLKTMVDVLFTVIPQWFVRKTKGIAKINVGSSPADCLSMLSRFGINIEFLPITMNGKLKEQPAQLSFEPFPRERSTDSKNDDINYISMKRSEHNGNSKLPVSLKKVLDDKKESAELSVEPFPRERSTDSKVDDIDHISLQRSEQNGNNKLPVNLKKVLDDNSFSEIIWWVCDGKAFAVKNSNLLCDVLKKYFRGIKKSSFFRSLKRWGFQRLRTEESPMSNIFVFQHALFQENLPLSPDHLKLLDDSEQVTSPKFKFMKKLHKILETEKAQHAIWWQESDDAFAINKKKFTMDILTEDYNGIQFLSFRRSLKRWGFKQLKADGDILVFQHPSFRKDWLDPFVN